MNKLTPFFKYNFSGLNWRELITYKFWFGYDRFVMHTSDNLFLLAGLILVLLGVVTFIYSRITKNEFLALVVTKISKIFFTIGLLEVFWYFLRYQYVQALSTRFVAVLILIVGLVWMYWPVKYFITRYKVDMTEAQRKASREKYLNLK